MNMDEEFKNIRLQSLYEGNNKKIEDRLYRPLFLSGVQLNIVICDFSLNGLFEFFRVLSDRKYVANLCMKLPSTPENLLRYPYFFTTGNR